MRAAIPGLSDRMLSERLRELEREGIVSRVVVPEMPVRVEYQLTPKGLALEPVMDALIVWIAAWGEHRPVPLTREEEHLRDS
jgi:DNA-binding HxlR family transcriptional regulator